MEDRKAKIKRFDGKDFAFWEMQIQDLLHQKDLYLPLKDKPTDMKEEDLGSFGPSSTRYGQIDVG